WRRCDGFVVVMAWIYGGGDGGETTVVGDESGKGVSWWDGADVMVTVREKGDDGGLVVKILAGEDGGLPEKISGGGAGQWRLPEIGEEGERELGLCVCV
ncbi:hypothetical protein Tco_0207818, partial [Tanacetum coccineum]